MNKFQTKYRPSNSKENCQVRKKTLKLNLNKAAKDKRSSSTTPSLPSVSTRQAQNFANIFTAAIPSNIHQEEEQDGNVNAFSLSPSPNTKGDSSSRSHLRDGLGTSRPHTMDTQGDLSLAASTGQANQNKPRDTRKKRCTTVASNSSGSALGRYNSNSYRLQTARSSDSCITPGGSKIYMPTLTENMDVPLPQILKKALRASREYLVGKQILDANSLTDTANYPPYQPRDPLKNTPRELTLTLLKQHEFLLNRVVAMHELGLRGSDERFGAEGKVKFINAIKSRMTNSQRDKMLKELQQERCTLKAQIKQLNKNMDETEADNAEKQIVFDMTDENLQELSKERNKNSQLQAKVMQAERQVMDSLQEIDWLREEHQVENEQLKEKLEQMQKQLDELQNRDRRGTQSDQSRVQSPMETSVEFAYEVRSMQKQQTLQKSPFNNELSIISSTNEIFNQDKPTPNRGSPSMSFAKSANNCSLTIGDFGGNGKPTIAEINLRAEKSTKRSLDKESNSQSGKNVAGGRNGIVGPQTAEDNFRNQLMMTSLNDELIEQWSVDQKQYMKNEEALLTFEQRWSLAQRRLSELSLVNKSYQSALQKLEANNTKLEYNLSTVLDKFQQYMITQDGQKQVLIEKHQDKVASLQQQVIQAKSVSASMQRLGKQASPLNDSQSGRKNAFDLLHLHTNNDTVSRSDMKGNDQDQRYGIFTGNASKLVLTDEQSNNANKHNSTSESRDLVEPMSFNEKFAEHIRQQPQPPTFQQSMAGEEELTARTTTTVDGDKTVKETPRPTSLSNQNQLSTSPRISAYNRLIHNPSAATTVSQVVNPGSRQQFIQSVYLAILAAHLLNKTNKAPDSNQDSTEFLSQKLLNDLPRQEDQQLLNQMQSSLQQVVTIIEDLIASFQVDAVDLLQVQQASHSITSQIRKCLPKKKDYLLSDMEAIVEHISRHYVNKQVESLLYRQAMCCEGKDAQMLLKTNIEDMLTLKMENQALVQKLGQIEKSGGLGSPIRSKYFAHHQVSIQTDDSQVATNEKGVGVQSCDRCQEITSTYMVYQDQMKKGKVRLEESANLVEEVSFELKCKDAEVERLKEKLVGVVKLFKDTGIKANIRERLPLESLCDVTERCVKRLMYKVKKEKAANKTFQEAMLKELAQLNHDLAKRRQHKQKRTVDGAKGAAGYTSNFGVEYSQTGHSGHTPQEPRREQDQPSIDQENQQFMNTFQQMKDQMVGHIQEKHIRQHITADAATAAFPTCNHSRQHTSEVEQRRDHESEPEQMSQMKAHRGHRHIQHDYREDNKLSAGNQVIQVAPPARGNSHEPQPKYQNHFENSGGKRYDCPEQYLRPQRVLSAEHSVRIDSLRRPLSNHEYFQQQPSALSDGGTIQDVQQSGYISPRETLTSPFSLASTTRKHFNLQPLQLDSVERANNNNGPPGAWRDQMATYRKNIYNFIESSKKSQNQRHERVRHHLEMKELRQQTEGILQQKEEALKRSRSNSRHVTRESSANVIPYRPDTLSDQLRSHTYETLSDQRVYSGQALNAPQQKPADQTSLNTTRVPAHHSSMARIMGNSNQLQEQWRAISPKGERKQNLTERFPLLSEAAGDAAAETDRQTERTRREFTQEHYARALVHQMSTAQKTESIEFQLSMAESVEAPEVYQEKQAKRVKFDGIRSKSREIKDRYEKQIQNDYYARQTKIDQLKAKSDAWNKSKAALN